MKRLNKIDELYALDDGNYLDDDEEYFESEYPDEKGTHADRNTIVVDELEGINFSDFNGDFKSSLKRLSKATSKNTEKINRVIAPSNVNVIVEGKSNTRKPTKAVRTPKKKIINSLKLGKNWGNKDDVMIQSPNLKSMTKVLVPGDMRTIVQGVNSFILSKDCNANNIKTIGYCGGKKLKEMVFLINNEGLVDYNVEFFNPSTPMDYYQSTSQNINDRISVAGNGVSGVQYTDVLSHMLSNPTKIYNCRVVITSSNQTLVNNQRNQNFFSVQKDLRAYTHQQSINIPQLLDSFQSQGNIISFNFEPELHRPFVPDGLDILRYTVLAGLNVAICFYYEQKMIKKYFYKELRDNPNLF